MLANALYPALDRPVIPCPQVELQWRREGRSGAEHPERVRIGQAIDLGNALPERRRIGRLAGRSHPVTTKTRGIGLFDAFHELEPCTVKFEQPRDGLDLDTPYPVGRAIDVEGGVAQMHGVEQRQLHALPLHLIEGRVELQSMAEELALESDLIVNEVV